MSKQDGGPAFPIDKALQHGSMSLRDYFAAQAMQGMASAPMGKFTHKTFPDLCGSAYALADAMLAERNKE